MPVLLGMVNVPLNGFPIGCCCTQYTSHQGKATLTGPVDTACEPELQVPVI